MPPPHLQAGPCTQVIMTLISKEEIPLNPYCLFKMFYIKYKPQTRYNSLIHIDFRKYFLCENTFIILRVNQKTKTIQFNNVNLI